jgi:iron complex transport system ATP-binding protein
MAIARTLAMVPQHAIMPDAFTGWEVVLAGRTPHIGVLRGESPADEAIAQRALTLVDAAYLAGRRVGELSGGEQQRLLLARALAQEPAVLLLDEPTTHLDLPHQLGILDLMLRVAREQRLAILAVFHDLNLASSYCDEIVLMRDGQFLAHGTPAETLSSTAIEMTYGLRVPVIPHPQSGRPVVLVPPARSASAADVSPWPAEPDASREAVSLATEEVLAR